MADETTKSGSVDNSINVGKKRGDDLCKDDLASIKLICGDAFLCNNDELQNLLAIHCTFDIFFAAGDAFHGFSYCGKSTDEDDFTKFKETSKIRLFNYNHQFYGGDEEVAETFCKSVGNLFRRCRREYDYYVAYMTIMSRYHLFGRRFSINAIRMAGIFPKSNTIREEERIRYVQEFIDLTYGNNMFGIGLLLGTGIGGIYCEAKKAEKEKEKLYFGGWEESPYLPYKMVLVRNRNLNEADKLLDVTTTLDDLHLINFGQIPFYGIIFTKDDKIRKMFRHIKATTFFYIDHGMKIEELMCTIRAFNRKRATKHLVLVIEGEEEEVFYNTTNKILEFLDPGDIHYVRLDERHKIISKVMNWAMARINMGCDPLYLDIVHNSGNDEYVIDEAFSLNNNTGQGQNAENVPPHTSSQD